MSDKQLVVDLLVERVVKRLFDKAFNDGDKAEKIIIGCDLNIDIEHDEIKNEFYSMLWRLTNKSKEELMSKIELKLGKMKVS